MSRADLRSLLLAKNYDEALDLMWTKDRGSRFFFNADTDKGILQDTNRDPTLYPPLVMFVFQLTLEDRPFHDSLGLYEIKTLELLLMKTPATFFASQAAFGFFRLMKKNLAIMSVIYGEASGDQLNQVAEQLNTQPHLSLKAALVEAAAKSAVEGAPEAESLHKLLILTIQAHSFWVFDPVRGVNGTPYENVLAYYLALAKTAAREELVREVIKVGSTFNVHWRDNPKSFGGVHLMTAAVNTQQNGIIVRVARVVDSDTKASVIQTLEAKAYESDAWSKKDLLRIGEVTGMLRVL